MHRQFITFRLKRCTRDASRLMKQLTKWHNAIKAIYDVSMTSVICNVYIEGKSGSVKFVR